MHTCTLSSQELDAPSLHHCSERFEITGSAGQRCDKAHSRQAHAQAATADSLLACCSTSTRYQRGKPGTTSRAETT
eukprot:209586-Karenia_brevis.AAC.1